MKTEDRNAIKRFRELAKEKIENESTAYEKSRVLLKKQIEHETILGHQLKIEQETKDRDEHEQRLRERQICFGKFIQEKKKELDKKYFAKIDQELKSHSPQGGRPRLKEDEKSQKKSIRLKPDTLKILEKRSEKGLAAQIEAVVKENEAYKEREKIQIGLLKNFLTEIGRFIKEYVRSYGKNQDVQKVENLKEEIKLKAHQFQVFRKAFGIEEEYFLNLVSESELKDYKLMDVIIHSNQLINL